MKYFNVIIIVNYSAFYVIFENIYYYFFYHNHMWNFENQSNFKYHFYIFKLLFIVIYITYFLLFLNLWHTKKESKKINCNRKSTKLLYINRGSWSKRVNQSIYWLTVRYSYSLQNYSDLYYYFFVIVKYVNAKKKIKKRDNIIRESWNRRANRSIDWLTPQKC